MATVCSKLSEIRTVGMTLDMKLKASYRDAVLKGTSYDI